MLSGIVVYGDRHGFLDRRLANLIRLCIAAERGFHESSIEFQSGLDFHAFFLKLHRACFDFFSGDLHVYLNP